MPAKIDPTAYANPLTAAEALAIRDAKIKAHNEREVRQTRRANRYQSFLEFDNWPLYSDNYEIETIYQYEDGGPKFFTLVDKSGFRYIMYLGRRTGTAKELWFMAEIQLDVIGAVERESITILNAFQHADDDVIYEMTLDPGAADKEEHFQLTYLRSGLLRDDMIRDEYISGQHPVKR